jgi:hypothetical protein
MTAHVPEQLTGGAPEPPGLARDSRRAFLRRTGLVALPAALVAGGSPALAGRPRPGARTIGVNADLAAILIREIMNDEAAHVPILQGLLDDEDNPLNPKIRPMPDLDMARLVQPNVATFLEAASTFENTGSGTYGGALFAVQQTDEYFPTAVGLCTVESRHASFLNALLGEALVPDFAPVESPIPQEITLARVAPFVKDPVAGLPSFDPENASDENNFRILDFLLFLEYIEATFYRVNVPRLFR